MDVTMYPRQTNPPLGQRSGNYGYFAAPDGGGGSDGGAGVGVGLGEGVGVGLGVGVGYCKARNLIATSCPSQTPSPLDARLVPTKVDPVATVAIPRPMNMNFLSLDGLFMLALLL